jgi:poly(3-hydroxybutyrate) depolymerase
MLLARTVMPASRSTIVSALTALALLGACSRNPQPAAPAPVAAPPASPPAAAPVPAPLPTAAPAPAAEPATPDLSGDWNFVVDFPGQRMVGLIQLRRNGSDYTGIATPADAEGSATLTALTIDGNRVVMVFDSPDGEARAEAVLADDKTMNGRVTFQGNTGPFTARKS